MTDWRRAIETQVCPLCGRGPFLVLARHLNAAHDIDRHELRELAGLAKCDPACAPEHSDACSDRALTLGQAAVLPHQRGARGPLDWSEEGRRRLSKTDHSARVEAARSVKLARTHCRHGHPYTKENTRIGPAEGDRICRTCAREADRRHRAKAARPS